MWSPKVPPNHEIQGGQHLACMKQSKIFQLPLAPAISKAAALNLYLVNNNSADEFLH